MGGTYDKAKGTAKEAIGKVKQGVGEATDDFSHTMFAERRSQNRRTSVEAQHDTADCLEVAPWT
jgi:hypothetical protein